MHIKTFRNMLILLSEKIVSIFPYSGVPPQSVETSTVALSFSICNTNISEQDKKKPTTTHSSFTELNGV